MITDLSKSSINQVLDLINANNGNAGLTLNDIQFGTPVVSVGEKDTELSVSSKPNSGYNGSVLVEYNRLPLSGFEMYGLPELTIPVNGTLDDVLSGFNTLYDTALDYEDIPNDLDVTSVDYIGALITIPAKATSLAYKGSIDVLVKWPSTLLDTVITVEVLGGLEYEIRPVAQFIMFNQPSNYNFDDSPPTLVVTSTSELPVSLVSTTPDVCSVDGSGNISFLWGGQCSIRADQAGNEYFHPADPVTRSFTIVPVIPDPPANILGYGGSKQAALRFTPPVFKGGAAILNYTATSTPGNITASSATIPMAVAGLADDTTYTFVVTATNVAGESVYSVETAPITTIRNEFYPPYSWSALPQGLNMGANQTVNKIVTDFKGTVIAVANAGWASRSVDNGVTWSPLPQGLNTGSINNLVSLATDTKGVWVAVNSSGFASRSVDNGVTWTALPRGLMSGSTTGTSSGIATDTNGVWVATFATGFASRSIDNGVTWSVLPKGLFTGNASARLAGGATDENGVWLIGGHLGSCRGVA